MNKKEIKLYNVLFPVWMITYLSALLGSKEGFLILFIVLISNFIIDSLGYIIALKKYKIENKKEKYKKSILKIWGFGFLSDIIGVIPMFAINFITNIPMESDISRWITVNFINPVTYNPFQNILSFIWVILCIGLSMFCIYKFNYKISFKNLEIQEETKKKIALIIAFVTAPYLFLLPTAWFW